MRQNIIIGAIIAILTLLVCFVFTLFWIILGQDLIQQRQITPPVIALATAAPTFTVTFTPRPVEVIATATPSPTSTHQVTPSHQMSPTDTPTAMPTATPPPPTPTETAMPHVIANSTVNLRSGPGTAYPVIGSLQMSTRAPLMGQNSEGTWWQIQSADGNLGWVAASIVTAHQAMNLPIVQAPPPPMPTATATAVATPVPTKPLYQYEPTGWFSDKNLGLTRFLGSISDINGNSANGVQVEAQCGDYRVVSNRSGPTSGWAEGFYDITLARYPIPCKWLLTVVTTDESGKVATGKLSETIEIEVTMETSIVVANWRKNW